MARDFSPSETAYGLGLWGSLEERLDHREACPDACPTCGHVGQARASESKRLPNGVRHRRRTCRECKASWFTAEVSRDALLALVDQLAEAEASLADAHAADLDGAIGGIRSALKALEAPYRARREETHHATHTRQPQRARAIAPPQPA